jgi:hypothetical protein
MYRITEYSKEQAEKLGVQIKPSVKKNKKIDVIKNGKVVASIGDKRYKDYPTYIQSHSLGYANKKRKSFKARFKSTMDKKNSPSYYSSLILW